MSTPPEYFERLYRESADPWRMATSWYERRKYELTVASLPEPRYASGVEPGCSVGVLSERLATRCDALLCLDQSAAAADSARERLGGLPNVTVELRRFPEDWPDGRFDLLVLSEVCYYFEPDALGRLLATARGSLLPGATVVAVHWRGVTDYPLSGDETHGLLRSGLGPPLASHVEDDFLLDVWVVS